MRHRAWLVGAAALLGSLGWAAGGFVEDAGPASIDVSGYPEPQRKAYRVFAEKCSQCHTLARPINAPYARREEWQRFARRMHARGKGAGRPISKEQLRAIVDFLVYDASVRKLARPEAWERERRALREKHAREAAERRKKADAASREKAKEYYDPAGVKPSPAPQ